ncbi:nucleotidyltransferase [Clostridium gasigenes]|uniref:cyclic GMP-AMP synthase DncV-like nucleotidyltransferase n=1 Tax=Clostridium gasigenes TaxID=94869 RepID=UPI00162513A8|nr:nucleotidyltransferase [Clostridium gasigenes]MBB6622388.1 nucleotidyltransferase [Clostridium gasigenes]
MADIQKQLLDFHDEIKLGKYEESATLREKRDIITKKVENGLVKYFEDRGETVPTIDFFDQGSYAVDTGIVPKDADYDIDEGVIIGLNKEGYESDPTCFKKVVRDIMKSHTKKDPKIKNPCVTITYTKDDEPQYHVDLPIYLKSSEDDNLYLSWGKEFSVSENKNWQISDPKGLNNHIRQAFSGDDKKQFKRVIRYLKKWKDVKFESETSEGTPPSVALTIIASAKFNPIKEINIVTGKEEHNDLKAMKELVDELKKLFEYKFCINEMEYLYVIEYELPVENKGNVFSKMTNKKMNSFYEKVVNLQVALQYAIDETDPHKACKELAKILGDKLPIPDAVEDRYKTVGASSAPASNFA